MDASRGRQLWRVLHLYASHPNVSLDQQIFFSEWLAEVQKSLGCESCFKKVVWFQVKWPVDYGENFYLWSICLHDYVNKELGRPLFLPNLTLEPLTKRGILQ